MVELDQSSSLSGYFRSLEDTLEMTEDGNFPAVGSCFEELAEGVEFDVYDKYCQVRKAFSSYGSIFSITVSPYVEGKFSIE